MALKRYLVLRVIKIVIFLVILASIFHDQYRSLIKPLLQDNNIHLSWLDSADDWLFESGLIIMTSSWVVKALMLILFLILFPSGRNLLWFLLRKANSFVKLLPGKQTTELLERYLNMVKFANFKDQSRVYSRLVKQYPPGSKMLEGNRRL